MEEVRMKKINNCGDGDCVCNGCLHHSSCERGCKHCKGEHFTCLIMASKMEKKNQVKKGKK